MPTRQEIIKEARSWIDTPFTHQGRAKTKGCDCAGVVIAVGIDIFGIPFKEVAYGIEPNRERMQETLNTYLTPIEVEDAQPGDVLWIKIKGQPQHLAILTERGTIIHSYAGVGRVVEHSFDNKWKRRVYRAYRYPGVDS
jgi:NlpC/P60 family putative phage cell wall peptidase